MGGNLSPRQDCSLLQMVMYSSTVSKIISLLLRRYTGVHYPWSHFCYLWCLAQKLYFSTWYVFTVVSLRIATSQEETKTLTIFSSDRRCWFFPLGYKLRKGDIEARKDKNKELDFKPNLKLALSSSVRGICKCIFWELTSGCVCGLAGPTGGCCGGGKVSLSL